jgi:hypothetical protein
MIMNTRRFVAGLALATALSCASPVHAQVLGGNVNGAVGGTLSGSTRGVDAMARGSMNGTLDVDARDVGRIRDRATDVSGHAQRSTRATIDHTRANVQSKVEQAQGTSASVATRAVVTADGAADVAADNADASAKAAASVAGSAKGNVDSTVEGASSAGNSTPSAQGTLENATKADLRTDGSRSRASTSHDTRAKGDVGDERLDLGADASASGSAEAEVTTQR